MENIVVSDSSVAGEVKVEVREKGLDWRASIRPKRLSTTLSGSKEFLGAGLEV